MATITGDNAGNIINATNDNDLIAGLGGDDLISALAGDDTIDGGPGDDTMMGGLGKDTYSVDSAGDVIMEGADPGIDTVVSIISYTLGSNLENLTLSALALGINGTGNALNNVLTGNDWNNVLSGLVGNDTISAGAGADTVDGGMGIDSMAGGKDNDVYIVDNVKDVVVENLDEGVDVVRASVSFTLGANVEDLILTGMAAINGTGNDTGNILTGNGGANALAGLAGNDTLMGLAGNDTLDGGTGMDSLAGGTGNDSYVVDDTGDIVAENPGEGTDTVVSAIGYTLGDNLENLILTGTAVIDGTGNALANVITGNDADNVLDGDAGNDSLSGGGGNDMIAGGAGADKMSGGKDDDTYFVDVAGDMVLEAAGGGFDTIVSRIGYTLGANLENLILDGTANLTGTGNTLDNAVVGNGGNNKLFGLAGNDALADDAGMDTLDGGTGADSMSGGADNDTYIVDNALDSVSEDMDEGIDTVFSSVTFALDANFEILALTGAAAVNGAGNDLANMITGNGGANNLMGAGGNDTLNGGVGADNMTGGTGDDSYMVDNLKDVVTEAAMEGIDTVTSSVSFKLGDNLENLVLTGMAVNGTGNAFDNIITGNAAANTLDGGMGRDTLSGGKGSDVYLVDDPQDIVLENLGEGVDTVRSSAVSYSLLANIENLTLIGTAVAGSGNELDNVITGNAQSNSFQGFDGNDTILGADGDDSIFAGVGNDSLDGGTGNDFLNGETGADKMSGGMGNDTYVVDDAGDMVIEAGNGGNDEVISLISHTLAANVETLTLIGSGLTGTGNMQANTITSNGENVLQGMGGNDTLMGSGGKDTLDGGIGIDSMAGGLGDDLYIVNDGKDVVSESMGEGTDTVRSFAASYTLADNVENLALAGIANINATGNALDNLVLGNIGNNLLSGMGGNDTLLGGAGKDAVTGGTGMDLIGGGQGADTLTGGADSDRFDFNSLDGSLDVITDFSSAAPGMGGDVLDLADLLAGFDPMQSLLDNFVRYVQQGSDTRVQVNADGMGMDFVDVAILQGVVGVTASQALANGNLDITPDP